MGSDRFVGELLGRSRIPRLCSPTPSSSFSPTTERTSISHHGYIYHACSVYQSGLEVPLGFVAEGLIAPNGIVSQNVELGDVMPTLLDLFAIEPPVEMHGNSLVPYLARPDATGQGKPAFSEFGDTEIHTSWMATGN